MSSLKIVLCGLFLLMLNGCWYLEREPLPLSLGLVGLIGSGALIYFSTKGPEKKERYTVIGVVVLLVSLLMMA